MLWLFDDGHWPVDGHKSEAWQWFALVLQEAGAAAVSVKVNL
jgi:hypothetical protein